MHSPSASIHLNLFASIVDEVRTWRTRTPFSVTLGTISLSRTNLWSRSSRAIRSSLEVAPTPLDSSLFTLSKSSLCQPLTVLSNERAASKSVPPSLIDSAPSAPLPLQQPRPLSFPRLVAFSTGGASHTLTSAPLPNHHSQRSCLLVNRVLHLHSSCIPPLAYRGAAILRIHLYPVAAFIQYANPSHVVAHS